MTFAQLTLIFFRNGWFAGLWVRGIVCKLISSILSSAFDRTGIGGALD